MPKAQIGEIEIYYEQRGNGEPVCWCRLLGGRAIPGTLAWYRSCRSVTGRSSSIAAHGPERQATTGYSVSQLLEIAQVSWRRCILLAVMR